MNSNQLVSAGECRFQLSAHGPMRVPAVFYGAWDLIHRLDHKVLEQAANVACLPGIVRASLVMPDAHWGYGFPIGGVAAFDPDQGGIISVGGIGYDISCGVRSLHTSMKRAQIEPHIERAADLLFLRIPAGVGSQGAISLNSRQLDQVLVHGAAWAVAQGYGDPQDLANIEDSGRTPGADPSKVSPQAKQRQYKQMGTLGSGNHYLEIQAVDAIYDRTAAEAFGLDVDDILISIHCGSRALGHQIGTDYLQTLGRAASKYKIALPERELVCAPIRSPEGRDFYQAMACGINCALANRQILSHLVRESFAQLFPAARLSLIYDVSHNTCKIEEHMVDGQQKAVYVHRKGATRAYGPGHPDLPAQYRDVGQPVLIGGTMGSHSYILAGNRAGEDLAWSSACHGAGRSMSRKQALKKWKGQSVINALAHQGIVLRTASRRGAAEEAPQAYKDVNLVVESTHRAGLARKVARVTPLACIKG
ncbi:RtcB family protein [Desulfovermiculus halophilus]|uniref:RtcB family protein n=1 Tax=Desulfovermiculus halophilus TaxID=339722 RepID=UPI0004830450|nr:RtcB family protein [Desulfovermiculus halophilus]